MHPTRQKNTGGFTLVELMAVIFIIGIIVSFAGLSINQHSDHHIEDEARRIHHLLRMASEEAVLQGQELSFVVTSSGYEFAVLEGDKWEPIAGDKLFRGRDFPEEVRVDLSVYGQEVQFDDQKKAIQIYLLSSGEVTPFRLAFKTDAGEVYAVEGELTGAIDFFGPGDQKT